jgi:four helix bundle protein
MKPETAGVVDLKPRTKKYALNVIRLYQILPKTREEARIIGRQFLRSGTSVAANYREASRARSRAEFISKIEICAQEADETQLWLELLGEGCSLDHELVSALWKESDELISIFVTMSKNTKSR